MIGESVVPRCSAPSESNARARTHEENIRVSNEASNIVNDQAILLFRVIDTCVGSLATIPALVSSSGESTRDTELFDLVCKFEDEAFFVLASTFMHYARLKMLHLSSNHLIRLLEKTGKSIGGYMFSGSDDAVLLVIRIIWSTVHVWAAESSVDDEIVSRIKALCAWVVDYQERSRVPSWKVGDAMVCFLDDYLRADPREAAWDLEACCEAAHDILHSFIANPDIRVRWRSVIANARSFEVAKALQVPSKDWYVEGIHQRLSVDMVE